MYAGFSPALVVVDLPNDVPTSFVLHHSWAPALQTDTSKDTRGSMITAAMTATTLRARMTRTAGNGLDSATVGCNRVEVASRRSSRIFSKTAISAGRTINIAIKANKIPVPRHESELGKPPKISDNEDKQG